MPGVFIAFVATVRSARRPSAITASRRSLNAAREAGALRRLVDQCRYSNGLRREALSAPLPFWGSHAFLVAGDSRGRRKGVLP